MSTYTQEKGMSTDKVATEFYRILAELNRSNNYKADLINGIRTKLSEIRNFDPKPENPSLPSEAASGDFVNNMNAELRRYDELNCQLAYLLEHLQKIV